MDWNGGDMIQIIQGFIEDALFNKNIEKINQFFYSTLTQIQPNLQDLVEISRIFGNLAFVTEKETLIESLMQLLNYLSFNQIERMGKQLKNEENNENLKNFEIISGENHEILIKLCKIMPEQKSLKIVQRIKNFGSLKFDEFGNFNHDCQKVVFLNNNGLVFVNSNSGIKVQIFSIQLQQGHQIDLTNGSIMRVEGLNTNICTLTVMTKKPEKLKESLTFNASCKDLSLIFRTCRVPVLKLRKNANKWVLKNPVLNNLQSIYLELRDSRDSADQSFEFIASGSQIFLSKSLYKLTYSYV